MRHILIPLSWALLILAMHSIPGFDLAYRDPWQLLRIDKLAHAGMFAAFVAMLMVAFRKQDRYSGIRIHAQKISVLISISYGGLLELYQGQLFVERTSDLHDFAANTIGAFLGLILFRMVYGHELART
ncbi:MAG: VanZ family protein [Flavobacteriales bacterium]|nr:VanZ family protein [Flavobacteriales bacterium]